MSNQPDVLAAGSSLSYFTLENKLGDSNAWRARDTRSSRAVQVTILSRHVPRDRTRRDALLRDVRNAAAVRHSGLAEVYAIDIEGDTLFVASELIPGSPLSQMLAGSIPTRADILNYTWQIAEALEALHAKGVVHGELSDANVIVTPQGVARVTGLGFVSLVAKRVDPSELQHRSGADLHAASYFAPEEILGKPIDARSDLFSVGVLVYQLCTGRLPFQAAAASELANAICYQAPAAPQLLRPNVDSAIVAVIGRCLQKDPAKRYQTAAALMQDLKKIEPSLGPVTMAAVPRTPATAPARTTARAIVFAGELPYHDLLRKKEPERAMRLEAKMQQILGEAAYLHDGQVLDSFGARMVAEMPDVNSAIAAAHRALEDVAAYNASAAASEIIEPRLVIHAGDLVKEGAGASGPVMELSTAILNAMEPLQLLVSEAAYSKSNVVPPPSSVATFQNVRFFAPPVPEPEPQPVAVAEPEVETAPPVAAAKKSIAPFIAIAAGVLVIFVAAGYFFLRSKSAPPTVAAPVQASVAPKPAAPSSIDLAVAPFTIEAPEAAGAAETVRLASAAIFRLTPGVQVTDASSATAVSAKVRKGAAGLEIVPTFGSSEGSPLVLSKPGEATAAYVRAVASQLHIPEQRIPALGSPALDAFARAVALSASGDNASQVKALAAIREAIATDAGFLPAQLLAVDLFDRSGDRVGAIDSAQKVVAIDPSQTEVARRGARWLLEKSEPGPALDLYAKLLAAKPADAEALTAFGQYALSVGDSARFEKARVRMAAAPDGRLHAPDAVLAVGKIDVAAQRYYDVESQQPENPHLALKVGRIAVLRRSSEIPDIELKKLERLDPAYGAHVMKAYLAAQKGKEAEAETELKIAFGAAQPGDSVYTSAAEVYAILSRPAKAIQALKTAVGRSEPTGAYILANPLFRYLQSDAGFGEIRLGIEKQAAQVSTRLAADF